jgi:hypothetical protein
VLNPAAKVVGCEQLIDEEIEGLVRHPSRLAENGAGCKGGGGPIWEWDHGRGKPRGFSGWDHYTEISYRFRLFRRHIK